MINESKHQFSINQEKNAYLCKIAFFKELFGEPHPYADDVKLSDYNNLDNEDLKLFYQNHFRPSNCKMFISGRVDEKFLELVNDTFGKNWEDRTALFESDVITIKPSKSVFIEKPDSLQSAIRIGGLTIGREHPDFVKLQIAVTIFGGYFGSRLMKNIREDKGYTYGIGANVVCLKNECYLTINTEVKAEVTLNALAEVNKELNLMQKELVTEEELSLVKNYLFGELYRSVDGPFNLLEKWKGMVLSNHSIERFEIGRAHV